MNKGLLVTTMTCVAVLSSFATLWITKLDQYVEAGDNMLMNVMLVALVSIVFGIGIGTLYIAYLSGESKPKKMPKPPKPPKGQEEFILGGR